MQRTLAALTTLIALTAGCSSTGSGNNANNLNNDNPDMTVGPDLAQFDPGPYPTNNPGITVGKTLANLSGKGYLLTKDDTDASALTLQTIAVDVIRKRQECKCLMLSQSATWCGPCNAEQQELIDAVTADPSFCVFNVLIDGPVPGTRATSSDVLDWNQRHFQNFPVIGANISTYAHLPNPMFLPTNVVVRPSTMEILYIGSGLGPTTISDAKALCAGN